MRRLAGHNIGRARARSRAGGSGEPSDSGSVAIGAVGFGMLAMLAVSSIVGGIVVEHRAVEDSLTQTRLYWAAMGHAAYVLSRTRQSGPCAGNCPDPLVMAAGSQSLLNEISDLQLWRYPEAGSVYRFRLSPIIKPDPRRYLDYRSKIMFRAAFSRANPLAGDGVQALREVPTTRPVEVRYCITDTMSQTAPGTCVGDGNSSKVSWIVSVHRPAIGAASQ